MLQETSVFRLIYEIIARIWCCLFHRHHRKMIGGWDGVSSKYADFECQKCGRVYQDVVIGTYETGLK